MLRAMMLASIAFAVAVATTHTTQTAEACGVKLTVRSPSVTNNKQSSNPSKILIVGDKDSDLQKSLRQAGHTVEHASTATGAKKSGYQLVIADSDSFDSAVESFQGVQVVKKRGTSRSTAKTVERALARVTVDSSAKKNVIARSSSDKTLVEAGRDRSEARAIAETGRETPTPSANTPTANSRPNAALEGRDNTRVAVATQPKAEKPEKADKPEADKGRQNTRVTAERPVRETKVEPAVEEPVKPAVKVKWTRELRFGTNKTSLGADAKKNLTKNAKWLEANPDRSITIEGHTDTVGDEAYNMDLSERRANAARDFLISIGVDSSRISVDAKGEQDPAYQPGTSGKNRRIVLVQN